MTQYPPFHGEFTSPDASTPANEAAARVTIYDADKNVIGSLAATTRLVITDLTIVSNAALRVDVFDGADATVDAGERVAMGQFGANGGVKDGMQTPHFCKKGTFPKVKASGAGQVDVHIRGRIVPA